MTVNVQSFEKPDRLADLMKVMNIVQNVYGIKTDLQRSKILSEQYRQEKIKADDEEKRVIRRREGTFNQEEYDKLLTQGIGPETDGAVPSWIDESVVNPKTNLREKNEDGTYKVNRKMFWYVPEGNLLGTERQFKNADAKSRENQLIAIDNGYLTPSLLLNKDFVGDYSYEDKSGEGYQQGKLFLGNREQKPVWYITPGQLKIKQESEKYMREDQLRKGKEAKAAPMEAARLQGAQLDLKLKQKAIDKKDNPAAQKTWETSSADVWQGVEAAKRAGLANPTPTEADEWNPTQIRKDRESISKRIQQAEIEPLVAALNEVDRVVGIDRIGKVPGIGSASRVAAEYIPFGIGNRLLGDDEKEVKSAVDNVVMRVRRAMAGANVTPGEAKIVMDALGTNVFDSETSLRNGMRAARRVTKQIIQNIESAYGQPSLRAWRSQPNAIHSEIPLFKSVKETRAPAATDEEAIDRELEGQ